MLDTVLFLSELHETLASSPSKNRKWEEGCRGEQFLLYDWVVSVDCVLHLGQ